MYDSGIYDDRPDYFEPVYEDWTEDEPDHQHDDRNDGYCDWCGAGECDDLGPVNLSLDLYGEEWFFHAACMNEHAHCQADG